MEYLGPTGFDGNYKFTWEQLLEMCHILSRLHARNFVHNDIKPSNFVKHHITGKLYMIDFEGSTYATRSSRPCFYTEGFIAPERIEEIECGCYSDIFSLGIMFAHQVCYWQLIIIYNTNVVCNAVE